MAEGNSHSLIKLELGNLSKPADTLIRKISEAVGGLYKPYQIERVAKAEAKAALIKTKNELEITDLHRRAMYRFVEEEAQRQKNMEDITAKAVPRLDQNSDASKMEDDWITNFFDKARIVSNEEMQELWSRILAGEANAPGTYSRRTVNFLADLDKADVQLFTKLCGFCWMVGEIVPLVFDIQAGIYNSQGIDLGALNHLESIGLIQLETVSGFGKSKLRKNIVVFYYGEPLALEMPNDADNMLVTGHVLFSKTGQELAPIAQSQPVNGFKNYVIERWKTYLPKPKTEPNVPSEKSPAG